jgi:hypothetical protein
MAAQIAQKTSMMRSQIDSGSSASIAEGTAAANASMKQAGEMRSQFDAGSAYMDLYNYKRNRVAGEASLQLDSIGTQENYLQGIADANDWSKSLQPWANVAVAGLSGVPSFLGSGYANKWWQ